MARSVTVFRFGYSEIAELTDLRVSKVQSELGDLSHQHLRKILEFVALHGKFDLRLDIVLYACAREKTQVSSWRRGATNRGGRQSPRLDQPFCFDYDDLVELTGLEKNTVQQHKSRRVFDPNDLRSVLVELVARFSREEVKVGLVIRACQNTDFHDFLSASTRKLRSASG